MLSMHHIYHVALFVHCLYVFVDQHNVFQRGTNFFDKNYWDDVNLE